MIVIEIRLRLANATVIAIDTETQHLTHDQTDLGSVIVAEICRVLATTIRIYPALASARRETGTEIVPAITFATETRHTREIMIETRLVLASVHRVMESEDVIATWIVTEIEVVIAIGIVAEIAIVIVTRIVTDTIVMIVTRIVTDIATRIVTETVVVVVMQTVAVIKLHVTASVYLHEIRKANPDIAVVPTVTALRPRPGDGRRFRWTQNRETKH